METIFNKIRGFFLWVGAKNRRVFVCDFLCIAAALAIGYSMRLTFFFLLLVHAGDIWGTLAVFSSAILAALYLGRIYSVFWQRASVEEYFSFARWYFVGISVFVILNMYVRALFMPRSTLLIAAPLAFIFMMGMRATFKLTEAYRKGGEHTAGRALIVGAGDAGTAIARDLLRKANTFVPVGFIDDDPGLRGMTIASLKVLGGRDVLHDAIADHSIDTVLIAMPSASGEQLKEYVDMLSCEDVTVRVLPSILSLADGQVNVSRLRSVELKDLLRREAIELDAENIKSLIAERTVLVTGAGGSIGSEICRQILYRKPKRLIALGHGEQSIYNLLEGMTDEGIDADVVPVIADVADRDTMRMVFEKFSPQLVFHAGAHKHVPLMEDNPREALRVNSFGTWNIADLAGKYGVERFVMISTDKAVHPTSVMGAAKRAAERLLLSVQKEYPCTKYMAVRFGNVLGSRGSVVPKFERQIASGGPVTVTHREMTRYFMLIPEAVSLVLQAGAMGRGGELFVLDMGKPVKIYDMARTLIRLHGYEPDKDIKIVCTGIRPGEKLFEELFYDTAHVDKTAHSKIFKTKLIAEAHSILPEVERILSDSAAGKLAKEDVRSAVLALGVE